MNGLPTPGYTPPAHPTRKAAKLNIHFEKDSEGKERPVVTDDRGYAIPGIRACAIDWKFNCAAEVTLKLLVNRVDITVGSDE